MASRAANAGTQTAIAIEGAMALFDGDEVNQSTNVTVRALSPAEIAATDAMLTNVTAGAGRGYRFTPTPMKFSGKLQVSIAYNPVGALNYVREFSLLR